MVVSGILFFLCLLSIAVSKVPWALDELEEEDQNPVIKRSGKITKEVFPKGTVLVDESSPAANTRRKKPVVSAEAISTATKGMLSW